MQSSRLVLPEVPFWPNEVLQADAALLDALAADHPGDDGDVLGAARFCCPFGFGQQ